MVGPEESASIKIDQIREVVGQTAFRPFEGRYRVVVIDNADLMGEDAQNALLKLSPPSQGGRSFGLHPALQSLLPLWQSGRMAVLCNVGTLIAPITVTDYKNNRTLRPDSLFSMATLPPNVRAPVALPI